MQANIYQIQMPLVSFSNLHLDNMSISVFLKSSIVTVLRIIYNVVLIINQTYGMQVCFRNAQLTDWCNNIQLIDL